MNEPHNANLYSPFTVIGCVTFPTVIWQWLSQPTAVPMTLNDIKEYSLISISFLGGNMHSQITVGNVTLPKAVQNTVKIFAVYCCIPHKRKKSLSCLFLSLLHTHSLPSRNVNFVLWTWILIKGGWGGGDTLGGYRMWSSSIQRRHDGSLNWEPVKRGCQHD